MSISQEYIDTALEIIDSEIATKKDELERIEDVILNAISDTDKEDALYDLYKTYDRICVLQEYAIDIRDKVDDLEKLLLHSVRMEGK